jgi:hypothetical protein
MFEGLFLNLDNALKGNYFRYPFVILHVYISSINSKEYAVNFNRISIFVCLLYC